MTWTQEAIEAALVAANGIQADAARMLGMTRQQMHQLVHRFGLAHAVPTRSDGTRTSLKVWPESYTAIRDAADAYGRPAAEVVAALLKMADADPDSLAAALDRVPRQARGKSTAET